MELGPIGIWSAALRGGEASAVREAAAELEELGYGALWFPAGGREGLGERIDLLLGATRKTVVATGIISVWTHPAEAVATEHFELDQKYPDRYLLGLGVSHAHALERMGMTYQQPLQKMRAYLDELDAAEHPVPREQRALAALGPLMLKLSGRRTLGTHPYFVPPEHTRIARETLGPDALVAPEQMVVLETDADKARAVARASIGMYLNAPNYTNNLLRLGFTAEDFANGGTDAVVDAIVAWGDPYAIQARIKEHQDAGANHVCIQVLGGDRGTLALPAWRALAGVLKS